MFGCYGGLLICTKEKDGELFGVCDKWTKQIRWNKNKAVFSD